MLALPTSNSILFFPLAWKRVIREVSKGKDSTRTLSLVINKQGDILEPMYVCRWANIGT
jgi:hypothetical protein